MRINIKGNVGKQEILEFIAKSLNTLEEAGVDEFKGVNFYFNPYVCGEKVVPQINGEAFEFTFSSAKKHVEYTTEKDGSKKANYKKCVTSDIDLNNVFKFSQRIECIPQEELDLERAKRIALIREKEREAEIEFKERVRKQKESEKRDRQCMQECCEYLCEKLGLSEEGFGREKSSFGWITTKRGIQKYCDDLTEDRVFRISMHIRDRKEKMVYLFSESASILYEGVH